MTYYLDVDNQFYIEWNIYLSCWVLTKLDSGSTLHISDETVQEMIDEGLVVRYDTSYESMETVLESARQAASGYPSFYF